MTCLYVRICTASLIVLVFQSLSLSITLALSQFISWLCWFTWSVIALLLSSVRDSFFVALVNVPFYVHKYLLPTQWTRSMSLVACQLTQLVKLLYRVISWEGYYQAKKLCKNIVHIVRALQHQFIPQQPKALGTNVFDPSPFSHHLSKHATLMQGYWPDSFLKI